MRAKLVVHTLTSSTWTMTERRETNGDFKSTGSKRAVRERIAENERLGTRYSCIGERTEDIERSQL